MSSFICDSKHFDSVEQTLIEGIQFNTDHWAYTAGHLFTGSYTARNLPEDTIRDKVLAWGDALRRLQVLCVSLQYKHHYQGTLDKEIAEQTELVLQRRRMPSLKPVALYKALGCILYQIELEHLTELRLLTVEEKQAMKVAKTLSNALAHFLARQAEGYEEAEWSL